MREDQIPVSDLGDEEQARLLQDLLEINQAMTSGTDRVLDIIWRKGARLIGAEHGSIRLLRRVGGRPALVVEAYFGEGWTALNKQRIMELGESISGVVAQSGCSRYDADVLKEKEYRGSFPEFRSKICVPIRIGNEIIGVMNFNNRAADAFDDRLVSIAEVFACQTALAVNTVRLNRHKERARRSLELSRTINGAINTTLDLDEVMHTLVDELGQIDKVTGVDVFIYDPAKQILKNDYRLKQGGVGSVELELGQGLVGAAAESRQVINIGDVRKVSHYRQIRACTRSELTMPMVQCGDLIGVINLESDRVDAFDEHDEELLEAVTLAACIAIRNAHEYKKLQQAQHELELANWRITDMEDDARFALTTYIHDEVQKTIGQLLVKARQRDEREILGLAQKLEQQAAKMRFELTIPILNMRVELMELIRETLPRMYPAVSGIEHKVRLPAFDEIKVLARSVKVLGYRFVRGAVTNVYEHADAGHVCIEADRRGDELLLRVVDNGMGFDTSQVEQFIKEGHYFFHDIRIRATQLGGSFKFKSKQGQGTTLELTVPLMATP
jgi:putative methionine-R-sulfoxide reductase with GAF domain